MPIRIVKGLDIPIAGAPDQEIGAGPAVSTVALLGGDYPGMRPAMLVDEGDRVRLGQPLFADRRRRDIVFTAPACGTVAAINRGARRALQSIVIRAEGDEEERLSSWPVDRLAALRRDQVVDALLASGMWTALRTRPYGRTPDPDTAPASLFVTATDTNPLAPRPDIVIDARREDFANGMTVVSLLTEGRVFLCHAPGADIPVGDPTRITVESFSGPHPSGVVGTHIHFLDPVGPNRTAWHIGYQDVIAIGRTFTTGRPSVERVIAVAGPAARRPRLIGTRLGAATADLAAGEIADGACRIVSGSILAGRRAVGPEAFLGRFHNQISLIPEGAGRADRRQRFTAYGGGAGRPGSRRLAMTTARNGRPGAFVPLGGFERVMPLDILPAPLLRALIVGDTDMARDLGCLELDEEDLALCTFVCPGKIDYGILLRDALARIEREG